MRWGGAVVALFLCLIVCLLVVATRVHTRRLREQILEEHREMQRVESEVFAIENQIRQSLRPAALARRWRRLVMAGRD